MRLRILLLTSFMLGLCALARADRDTIRNEGFSFFPDTLTVFLGDTVVFDIGPAHNVVQVGQSQWESNIDFPLPGGFELPFGGGEYVPTSPGLIYFICQPHLLQGMKGIIQVLEPVQVTDPPGYLAHLSGTQVRVPVLTRGSGELEAQLEGNALQVSGQFSGLSSPQVKSVLYMGLAGEEGPVVANLSPTLAADARSGVIDEVIDLSPEQAEMLQRRQLYLQIHTQQNFGGELRGQIVPESQQVYYARLMGSQEMPPVSSEGLGSVVVEAYPDEVVVSGSFGGLESDFQASHLHLGLAGENGGVLFALTPTLNAEGRGGRFEAADNTEPVSGTDLEAMADRMVYLNVHSADNPGGEIRGQLHGPASSTWRVFLSGPQEVPPVQSSGSGQLLLELWNDTLILSGRFAGLSSPFAPNIGGGAHIHRGLAGSNGGVAVPLTREEDDDLSTGAFMAADNRFPLEAGLLDSMFARALYVNIHTDSFPAGEIRGQILPQAQYYFHGLLSGVQEPGGVPSDGYGTIVAEVLDSFLTVSGSLAGLGSPLNVEIAGGAHIHYGLAGTNGGIAIGLSPSLSTDALSATFDPDANGSPLRPGLLDSLNARSLYVNIHSTEVPAGELRGQLLPEARNYFFAPLAGSSEVPPVNSPASGLLVGEWNGVNLTMSGSFADLGSAVNTEILGGGHLHAGLPGANGGVRQILNLELDAEGRAGRILADNNRFDLGIVFRDSLFARLIYANIHTLENGGGELRGQLRAPAVRYFTTAAQSLNEVPPETTTGQGALHAELNGDRLVAYGAFSGLEGNFDGQPAGGAHLHYGDAASTGGIAVGLNAQKAADNDTSGVFLAMDNVRTLSSGVRDSLLAGYLYFNLHSSAVRSGEIRGQVLPESNYFPEAQGITAPPSGAAVTIEGDSITPFVAEWAEGMDIDNDTLVYIWQLATDPGFASPLVMVNVGTTPRFETDYGTVAALLEGAGLNEGESIKLYHRALASDGSLVAAGVADSVTLTLGLVTDLDETLARQFQVHLYPVPTRDWLQVNVVAEERARGLLQLFDAQGRMLGRYPMELFAGENQQRLDLSGQAAGTYYLQLLVDGQPVPARKLFLQPD